MSALTRTIKRFTSGTGNVIAATASPGTTVYTCPADTIANLRDLQVCNISGSSRTYSLWIVPSGESPANKGLLVGGRTIAAGNSADQVGTDAFRFNHILTAGDTLRAITDLASGITVQCSGIEATPVAAFLYVKPKRLVMVELPTSSTSQFTVTGAKAVVKDLTICNFTATGRWFTLDIMKSGGSVGNSSKMFYQYKVPAYTPQQVRLSGVLETGDQIYAHAEMANAIALNISGAEAL